MGVKSQSIPFVAECTVPSCSRVIQVLMVSDLKELGWRGAVRSIGEPSHFCGHQVTDRTHLAWCPDCSAKYGVEE